MRGRGLAVENVDVVVILERPKLGPTSTRCGGLADALGIDASRVSVKGQDERGRGRRRPGEAIAAHAVALLKRLAED